MRAFVLLSALTMIAAVLAGCTGRFDIEQTEPLHIQIDGDGEESRLAAPDSGGGNFQSAEKSEFRIEGTEDVDQVTVVVLVTKVADDEDGAPMDDQEDDEDENDNASTDDSEPAVILIIVEDRDTQTKLAEERVEAGQTDQAAQVQLNVDVKGKNNVVVVTQAVQGVADVNVAAQGSGQAMEGDDQGETTTGSAPTTSSSATTTTYA